MSDRLKTYLLRIEGPPYDQERDPETRDAEVLGILGGIVSEAEENISDLLPDGYYAKVSEVKFPDE